MAGKGIGAVKGGISHSSKERDIYTIHSPPRPAEWKSVTSAYEQDTDKIEEALLARLSKSRCGIGLKAILKYSALVLFTPFYFLFYCIPKLIWDNAISPVVYAIIRFFTPPVQATILFVKRTIGRINAFIIRKKEQLQQKWKAFIDALKRQIMRIVLPIKQKIAALSLKVQDMFLRFFKMIFNPLKSVIRGAQTMIRRVLQPVVEHSSSAVRNVGTKIQNKSSFAATAASQKIESISNAGYQRLLKGGLLVNKGFQYIFASMRIIPRYFAKTMKEVYEELQQWFSFR